MMATNPDYDRFEQEAAEEVRKAQAITAAYQGLARALLGNSGTEGQDVTVGERYLDE
jgi:hypothetical protein